MAHQRLEGPGLVIADSESSTPGDFIARPPQIRTQKSPAIRLLSSSRQVKWAVLSFPYSSQIWLIKPQVELISQAKTKNLSTYELIAVIGDSENSRHKLRP
jgi:hypothetical protein